MDIMKSTVKALQVLELLCEEGEARVSYLAKDLGIKYSSMHRILATLCAAGYVEQDQDNSKYRATLKVYRLGLKVRKKQPLVDLARPYMEKLADQHEQTVNLAGFVDNHAMVIDRYEGSEPFITDHTMSRQLPAYCTAFGKVFLAEMSREQLEEYAANTRFTAYTSRTVTSLEELLPMLEEIKKQGYAVDEKELDDGVRCMAAPIRDEQGRVIGALSMSGRTGTMTVKKLNACKEPLLEAAMELSGKLGFEPK
jgi:IclR family KDG regulon transcriptional repressor